MAFHEVRLPEEIERGATGGPEFSTSVIVTGGGHEQRNVNWQLSRRRWTVVKVLDDATTYAALLAFFLARAGRAHGFRFKDWFDYQMAEQSIGTGDDAETDFQLFKRYSSGGIDHDRTIAKPVSGAVSMWLDAAPQTEGVDFTVDTATGIVSFASPPAGGVDVRAACAFDVPVRFDADQMPATIASAENFAWDGIEIVEIRV